jgi:hypothetical protein
VVCLRTTLHIPDELIEEQKEETGMTGKTEITTRTPEEMLASIRFKKAPHLKGLSLYILYSIYSILRRIPARHSKQLAP